MARKLIFPDGAFEKENGFSLSHMFKQRVYGADDVLNIRTSFYLGDLHNESTALCYTLKWVSANKGKDGKFVITTNRMEVKDDQILKIRSHSDFSDDIFAVCSQNNVIETIQGLDSLFLRDRAEVITPQLSPPPIYMHDSIHLSVAREIFDHGCKKDEIEYHIKRIECIRPQKIKLRQYLPS